MAAMTASAGAPPAGAAISSPDIAADDAQQVVRELAAVADYIARIKQEIGALQVHELYRDRIPTVHEELGCVANATASATDTILTAAEELVRMEARSLGAYRNQVLEKALEIFEACSFHDLIGQRISKVVEALTQLEARLARFAEVVRIRDAADGDPEDAVRQNRRKALMLNGPPRPGEGASQNDIDALFG
jgi:chemotaxis protein CheZ